MADKTGSGKAGKSGKDDQGVRVMNIPLKSEWIKVPRTKRSKRALITVREFVSKHMKSYDVKISQKVNEKVWIRGIHKPPAKIRVKVSRDSKGVVNVMLPEELVRDKKKDEKKGKLAQMKETLVKEKGLPLGVGPKEEILKKGRKKTEGKDEAKEAKEEPKKEEKKPEKTRE